MARPTKYSDEAVARIVQAIELGATYELAAAYGGITYETFNTWRQKKPQFSDAINAAEGRAVMGWLAKIERAANEGTWQAAAWKLERRYPHQYGRTVQEQSGKIRVDHRHFDFSMFSPEEQARLDELAARVEAGAAS